MTKEDVHDMVLLPLMNSKHSSKEILVKTIYLANECIADEMSITHKIFTTITSSKII